MTGQWWDRTKRRQLPVEDIVADYWDGMGAPALSHKYHAGLTTIRALLRAQGIRLRGSQPTRATLEGVVSEYLAGHDITTIARQAGASPSTVRSLLLEGGLQPPFRQPNSPEKRSSRQYAPGRTELPESVIDDYAAGKNIHAIANEQGCSHWTVSRWLRDQGVRLRGHGRAINDLPIEEIVEQYEAGWTLIELGERYGVSASTIERRLLTNSVQRRAAGPKFNPNAPSHTLAPEAIKMLHAGHRLREIAETLEVSETTLREVLAKAGVEVRGGKSKPPRLPDKALEMYDDGWSIDELAVHFDMTRQETERELVALVDKLEGTS